VHRLTALLVLAIASVLLLPTTQINGLTSQQLENGIKPFYSGDFDQVLNKVNQTVNGDFGSIDKWSISVDDNGKLGNFAISLNTSPEWIDIIGNETQEIPPDNQTGNDTNGEPLVEICGDGQDNDGDGLADEDCPIIPPGNEEEIPDQPTKSVNNTQTLRVCSVADIDVGEGLTKMLNLMNDYECTILIINGDYCYKSCDEVTAQLEDAGYTGGNTKISLGNHDNAGKTRTFNGFPSLNYGTAVFKDSETIESINAYLGVFILDGNTGLSGSTQFNYMKDQIESDESWYKFVTIHQPFVINDGGDHGENGQFAKWSPLFTGNGVIAVLQGHEHNYQRYDINGLDAILVGTGTHDGPDGVDGDLYKLGNEEWNGFECEKCMDTDNGFVLMDLRIDDPSKRSAHGWFISSSDNGEVKDKFNLLG
jgi:hypothetical protein